MSNWQEMEKKYLFTNTVRWPILPVKGKGSYLWDENGKKYLDLVGGWAVCCLGHSHPVITKALTLQSKTLGSCAVRSPATCHNCNWLNYW
jgi:acetylornithine/N-succinyldiaminopimelate aminotransferase